MTAATGYLIAMVCFAIATIAGTIVLIGEKGHWSQIAIPAALFLMAFALWWRARKPVTRAG